MLKKYLFVIIPMILTACIAQSLKYQSCIPMDMKAVQEYQKRVMKGNTVSSKARDDNQQLNQSDRAYKVKQYHHYICTLYLTLAFIMAVRHVLVLI